MHTVNQANAKDLVIFQLPGVQNINKKISSIPLKTLQYKKSKVFSFRQNAFMEKQFEIPEYNLYEIGAAEDADGIIRQSIKKKRALAMKEGYTIVGKNLKTVKYIRERFMQLGLAQNKSMELLFKDAVGDLVRYHNVFIKKNRDEDASGGKNRMVRGRGGTKMLKPVSAYFRMPPETMLVKKDKYGNPSKYMQRMPDGRKLEYSPDDIIHFVFNKRAGFTFAAPGLITAIDDVRALRRVEENLELLIEQHLFPLFTLTIGSDEWPAELYEDGSSEIDIWTSKLQELPASGGLVASHRHKFDILGYDKVLPIDKYLEHFKKRSYTSAGMSNLDMGEGEGMNRSTADNASKILIDDVKDYQKELQPQIEFEIIYELLLERYNETVLSEDNIVGFQWNEIDIENMMKLENHDATMYTMNIITEDEARIRNGMDVIDEQSEREKLFLYTNTKQIIDWETGAAKEVEASKPKTTAGTTSTKKSTNTTKNRNQPTNQHGKKSSSEKKKSSVLSEISRFLDDFYHYEPDLLKMRLINRLFTLDLDREASYIWTRIEPALDSIVDPVYRMVDDKKTSQSTARDTIVEQLKTILEL